ncbi:MAG: nucleotidyltransferase family protein, partial [Flavobacteriaceae bacterium]|nr:nucleotidyltransferase family protein [Flavobacteriaceae bacterium]
VAILLLAAGNSSRLGQPKQLLKWKSSNLLQHAIDTVKKVQSDSVILVLGANYQKIISEINTNSVHVLNNKTWHNGLGNSIAFGVNYIEKTFPEIEAILISLADQPLITKSYLLQMISEFNICKKQIIGTANKNNRLGVPALFDKEYFEELMQLNNDEGAKHIIKNHLQVVRFIEASQMFSDIDTLEAYKKLYNANH